VKERIRKGTVVEYFQHDVLIGKGIIVDIGTKNGMKVYDVELPNSRTFWGYRDQFKVVHKTI
jgi:hypothetical protein